MNIADKFVEEFDELYRYSYMKFRRTIGLEHIYRLWYYFSDKIKQDDFKNNYLDNREVDIRLTNI
jgi:hypothetical protein